MLRVEVEAERCQGHARCWAMCPEVFALDDDGYASVPEPQVPAEFESRVREAAATCPERAILITES